MEKGNVAVGIIFVLLIYIFFIWLVSFSDKQEKQNKEPVKHEQSITENFKQWGFKAGEWVKIQGDFYSRCVGKITAEIRNNYDKDKLGKYEVIVYCRDGSGGLPTFTGVSYFSGEEILKVQ